MEKARLGLVLVFGLVIGIGVAAYVSPTEGKSDGAVVQMAQEEAGGEAARDKFKFSPCPSGWKTKHLENAGFYSCVPKAPKKKKCPGNSKWFFEGCLCGCKPQPK